MNVFSLGRGPSLKDVPEPQVNARTSFFVNNFLLISLILSCFAEHKYFNGNMGTYKVKGAPPHNALEFFARGDPSKYT
jgi:hypothetical protein